MSKDTKNHKYYPSQKHLQGKKTQIQDISDKGTVKKKNQSKRCHMKTSLTLSLKLYLKLQVLNIHQLKEICSKWNYDINLNQT